MRQPLDYVANNLSYEDLAKIIEIKIKTTENLFDSLLKGIEKHGFFELTWINYISIAESNLRDLAYLSTVDTKKRIQDLMNQIGYQKQLVFKLQLQDAAKEKEKLKQ